MSYVQYAPGDRPAKGEVWKHRYNGQHYAFVAIFEHRPPTWKEGRDYVICQIYGSYRNEVEIIEVDAWPHLFDFAWGPLLECNFCGFRRMSPCAVRQSCPNLRDYRLEATSREEPADA